jgi:hypothetical protein
MRRAALFLLLGALGLQLAACGGDESGAGESVTIELQEQSASGQTGTATLTADGQRTTRVLLELENGTADPQPAHIHPGGCADLDPTPKHALENVVDGRSETVVQAPLSELTGGGLAINVHESVAEVQTYVACGDISGPSDDVEPGSNVRDY